MPFLVGRLSCSLTLSRVRNCNDWVRCFLSWLHLTETKKKFSSFRNNHLSLFQALSIADRFFDYLSERVYFVLVGFLQSRGGFSGGVVLALSNQVKIVWNWAFATRQLCQCRTPNAIQVFAHVAIFGKTFCFSDAENWSPSNLHGFEKMADKLSVVLLSESFIIFSVYFAEFNFISVLV